MAEGEDRTQAPSDRRQLQAREEGQAPLSRELVVVAGLGVAVLVVAMGVSGTARALGMALRSMLETSTASPGQALRQAAMAILTSVGPLLSAVLVASAGAVLLQTRFLLNTKAIMPDASRLDPRRGLKRVFGTDNAVEAVKAIAKLVLLGWAMRLAFQSAWPLAPGSMLVAPDILLDRIVSSIVHLALLVLAAQAGIALLDTTWTHWRFTQRLRMSREDLRQESREADGDPRLKGRLRQLRVARARKRMLAAVANATVVITNPTHYAVALSYDRLGSAAPRIVAKGMDSVAARIREAAAKAGVPLIANPELARALHVLPIDSEIPSEHFRVVAEVIAYIWRLRRTVSDRQEASV